MLKYQADVVNVALSGQYRFRKFRFMAKIYFSTALRNLISRCERLQCLNNKRPDFMILSLDE